MTKTILYMYSHLSSYANIYWIYSVAIQRRWIGQDTLVLTPAAMERVLHLPLSVSSSIRPKINFLFKLQFVYTKYYEKYTHCLLPPKINKGILVASLSQSSSYVPLKMKNVKFAVFALLPFLHQLDDMNLITMAYTTQHKSNLNLDGVTFASYVPLELEETSTFSISAL